MAKAGHPAVPGTRTSPCTKAKRRARTSNNGEPETPSARAKRKRKAESARVKAAAGEQRGKRKATEVQEIPAEKNTEEDDPVEIVTKPPKHCVGPPPGKKRKQFGPKKAVVKGGKDTIEEIDDNSTYTGNEVDEEEDESIDSEDGEGKRGADIYVETLGLDESSSDNYDSGDSRMERFERDIAKSNAAAERCRKESNLRAQQGAEDPPNNTTPMANVSTATSSTRYAGLTVPRGMSNAESIVKERSMWQLESFHL